MTQLALGLTLALLLAIGSVSAQNKPEFAVELELPGGLEVWGTKVKIENAAFSARHRGTQAANPMTINWSFSDGMISEYHESRTMMVGLPAGRPIEIANEGVAVTPHFLGSGNASFYMRGAKAAAAFVLGCLTTSAEQGLATGSAVMNPYLSDSSTAPRTASPVNSGERHVWKLNGAYATVPGRAMAGAFNCPLTLYVHESSVSVQNASGNREFVSRNWQEPLDSSGRIYRQHESWLVLETHGTQGNFSIPRAQESLQTAHYLRSFHLESATTISANGAIITRGSFPAGEKTNGTTVWIAGEFDVRFTAEPTSSTRIVGAAESMGFGGQRAENLVTPIVGSSVAVVLATAATIFARQIFSMLQGTVFLPQSARISRARMLEHPVRDEIMRLLTTDLPATRVSTFLSIASARIGISRLAVFYHLRQLERAGAIEVLTDSGRRRRFLVPNHGFVPNPTIKVGAALLQTDMGRILAETLLALPGARQAKVIQHAQQRTQELLGKNISRVAVHKWLRRFEEATFEGITSGQMQAKRGSLVIRRGHPRQVCYELDPNFAVFVNDWLSLGPAAALGLARKQIST